MIHEFHVGGFVRASAPPPVLLARGCAGLLAAATRRPIAHTPGAEVTVVVNRDEGMIGG